MLSKAMLKRLTILVAAGVLGIGCSHKDNRTYNMNQESLFAGGCLNLGNFYQSLHNMPDDGKVRAFTSEFTAADVDESGYNPSSSRMRILTRGAYFFSESSPSELRSTWTDAAQDGCASGKLIDSYGNSTPYTVKEFKGKSITVQLPDDSTQKFELTSDRSMSIFTDESRMSQCIFDAPIKTQTTIQLRWGPPSEMPASETVSSSFMRSLSKAVSEPPAGLRTSVADVSADSMSLASSLLMEMNSMQVSAEDLRACPTGNAAPQEPPLPTPTPSATPTPTPAPTPAATATPDPGPTP